MTRTTELLKELKECSRLDYELSLKLKSELKGRLAVLKDEKEFLQKIFGWSPNAINKIEEMTKEIKEIEEGVGNEIL